MDIQLNEIPDNLIAEEYVARFQKKFGERINKAEAAANHLRAFLRDCDQSVENFMVIFLNNQNQQITTEVISSGTINTAAVFPRQIVKNVIQHEASSVILGHNHPSGETTPSSSDRAITRKIKDALELISVSTLDHVIIGDGYYSFADQGLL